MRVKKCPYCGKRASYTSLFSSRRKGEFVCYRCGKESKVSISKFVYLVFIVAALISVALMVGWLHFGMASNLMGMAVVAIPLLLFTLISPKFVYFEPLKKYKKSMEARKAGIEYSDNLAVSVFEDTPKISFAQNNEDTSFNMNSDLFNKIKAEKNAARQQLKNQDIKSDSSEIITEDINSATKNDDEENFVPIIENSREDHASTDAPLKKIHSDSKYDLTRTRHFIVNEPETEDVDINNLQNKKKSANNRYSANRKF